MSGAAMAVIAILLAINGGVLFALFWLAAGAVVFWEWFNLVSSAELRERWLWYYRAHPRLAIFSSHT